MAIQANNVSLQSVSRKIWLLPIKHIQTSSIFQDLSLLEYCPYLGHISVVITPFCFSDHFPCGRLEATMKCLHYILAFMPLLDRQYRSLSTGCASATLLLLTTSNSRDLRYTNVSWPCPPSHDDLVCEGRVSSKSFICVS